MSPMKNLQRASSMPIVSDTTSRSEHEGSNLRRCHSLSSACSNDDNDSHLTLRNFTDEEINKNSVEIEECIHLMSPCCIYNGIYEDETDFYLDYHHDEQEAYGDDINYPDGGDGMSSQCYETPSLMDIDGRDRPTDHNNNHHHHPIVVSESEKARIFSKISLPTIPSPYYSRKRKSAAGVASSSSSSSSSAVGAVGGSDNHSSQSLRISCGAVGKLTGLGMKRFGIFKQGTLDSVQEERDEHVMGLR